MFILSYIYSVIIVLTYFIGSIAYADFWSFLLFGSIFALLYTNLIILCKYSTIFLYKIIKKEALIQNEIYFLITSIVIFITIGVVLTPMYDINQIAISHGAYRWEAFLFPALAYIFTMFFSSLTIIESLLKQDFSLFFEGVWINIFMWANFIILSKYLYRFIRKTTKKEPLTQKESILLITSLFIFVTLGMIIMPAIRV